MDQTDTSHDPDQTQLVVQPIAAEQTHALRHLVLRPHQTLAEMVYDCDGLPGTVHFGAFRREAGDDGDRLLGIVTLLLSDRDGVPWQLRGMATHPDARGLGAGRRLVHACLDHARRHAPTTGPSTKHTHAAGVWCNARVSAIAFYGRCGFIVASEEFDIPGIGPHVVMTTAPNDEP